MNTHHDELEQRLGQELRGRVDGMHDQPFGFADVKGRARRIQRNRRIAAGVGVAAAVAIITPVAMLAAQNRVADGDELDPAAPAPREMISTTLTLDGLERGDAPAIEYFTEDGVVLPGEGLQPLDQSYQAMVPSEADGGWVAFGPAKDEVVYLSTDFKPNGGSSPNNGFISDPSRSLVAFAAGAVGAQSLEIHPTTDPAANVAWEYPAEDVVDPVDFTGDDSLLFQTTTPQGRHEIGLANADGTTTPLPGYVAAISASPVTGDLAVQTKAKKDASGCFGVVDPSASLTEPVWETCDYSLGAFSPDGQYVLASTPYLSGIGVTSLAVLDATTGDAVARFTQASNTQIALVGVAWESADSVVAVALEGETYTIVRFRLDGTLEETVDSVKGDPYADFAFYLGNDRRRGY